MRQHLWMHKETGDLASVVPWMLTSEDIFWEIGKDGIVDAEMNIGVTAVVHGGWMFCNGNNVYFALGLNAKYEFEDLGEI